jgi:uncharacterized protein (DUF433 family)
MDDLLSRIHSDPKIMVGKPVVKGTRITVEHIMNELALGLTAPQLVKMYPRLTEEDVYAACAYASALLSGERVTSLAAE